MSNVKCTMFHWKKEKVSVGLYSAADVCWVVFMLVSELSQPPWMTPPFVSWPDPLMYPAANFLSPIAPSTTFTLTPPWFSVTLACSITSVLCSVWVRDSVWAEYLGSCHYSKVCQSSPTESCHISWLLSVFFPAKVPYFYWQTDTFIFEVLAELFMRRKK